MQAISGIEFTTSHNKIQPYIGLEAQVGRYAEVQVSPVIGARGILDESIYFSAELQSSKHDLSSVTQRQRSSKFAMHMRF